MKKMKSNKSINNKVKNVVISEGFSFHNNYQNIKLTHESYEYYRSHYSELKDVLTSDVLLAFDTNLLLDLYKMSNAERNEFLKFVENNAHRIIIPNQVEIEFLRHRVERIEDFHKQITDLKEQAKKYASTIKKAYSTASTQFKQLSQNSLIKNDMPDVLPHIKTLREYIEGQDSPQAFKDTVDHLYDPLSKSLGENIDNLLKNSITEFNDPILKSLSKTIITNPLSPQEMQFLHELYDSCLEDFNSHKDKGATLKLPYCFPGCGDRKKIKDGYDPTGDFIIYHQLLAYMKTVGKDIIFLTRDITKSDWITEDGSPFNHYIVDIYHNTGKMLYIFNAEKFIPLTFKPVIDDEDGQDVDEDSIGVEAEEEPTASTASNAQIEEFTIENEEDITPRPQDDAHIQEPRLPYLRDITKERFMDELASMETWAKENADNFVTVYRFIYQRLRLKRFDFNTSKNIMKELQEEGKIELYKIPENKNLCIRIKKDNI